jgi:hypothetical protein
MPRYQQFTEYWISYYTKDDHFDSGHDMNSEFYDYRKDAERDFAEAEIDETTFRITLSKVRGKGNDAEGLVDRTYELLAVKGKPIDEETAYWADWITGWEKFLPAESNA